MNLMTEVTEPVLSSAPVLHRSTKHHFIHTILPMDCVVTVPIDETLKVYDIPISSWFDFDRTSFEIPLINDHTEQAVSRKLFWT